MELAKVKCRKCGHTWIPRVNNPVTCPLCKSPKWMMPTVQNGKKEEK